MVYRTVGQMIELEAAMLLIPMLVALIYGEMNIVPSFLIPAVCAGVLGFIFAHTFPPRDRILYARDGFMIVALAWLVLSGIGALPFVISREIPSYIDAFFETASGFTTARLLYPMLRCFPTEHFFGAALPTGSAEWVLSFL